MTPSIDAQIPWNTGAQHRGGWIALIVLLTIGAILNAIQIFLHWYVADLKKLPNAFTILCLAIQDFTFNFLCLITCVACLVTDTYYLEESMCLWQGLYAELFMSASGMSLVSLLYASYKQFVSDITLSKKDQIRMQKCIMSFSLALSILGAIYPGKAKLNTSGLFCYSATQDPLEGILFFCLYVFPMFGNFIYMCWQVELMYHQLQVDLHANDKLQNQSPRPAQRRNYIAMWWYVLVMFLCYISILGVALYSWITRRHAPVGLWIAFGMSGHFNTLCNPILYYFLSEPARIALKNFVCQRNKRVKNSTSEARFLQNYYQHVLSDPEQIECLRQYANKVYSQDLVIFYFDYYRPWLELFDDNLLLFSQTSVYAISPTLESTDSEIQLFSPTRSLSSQSLSYNVSNQLLSSFVFNAMTTNMESPTTNNYDIDNISLGHAIELQSISTPPRLDIKESATSHRRLKELTDVIYKTFIADKAPLLLNVEGSMLVEIKEKFKNEDFCITRDLFESIAQEISNLMYQNLFTPLLQNDEFYGKFREWFLQRHSDVL